MGLGGVAIVILPSIMCLKLTFSDGLGGNCKMPEPRPTRNWLSSTMCSMCYIANCAPPTTQHANTALCLRET